jgi:hypothetical protein
MLMLDSMDSHGDRTAVRRTRRWRRRARIAAPFLVVPAMLGLLVLSVDLIEYRPSREAGRASERPRPARALKPAPTADVLGRPMPEAPEAALSVSVVGSSIPPSPAVTALAAPTPGLPAWMGDSPKETSAR